MDSDPEPKCVPACFDHDCQAEVHCFRREIDRSRFERAVPPPKETR